MSLGVDPNVRGTGGFESVESARTEGAQGSRTSVIEKVADQKANQIAPPTIKNANQPQSPSPTLTRRASQEGQLSPRPSRTADKTHDAARPVRTRPAGAGHKAPSFQENLDIAKELLPTQTPADQAKTLTLLKNSLRNIAPNERTDALKKFEDLQSDYRAKPPPAPPRRQSTEMPKPRPEIEAMAIKNGISAQRLNFGTLPKQPPHLKKTSSASPMSPAKELEGAPTSLLGEAKEILGTETKFRENIDLLASLGDKNGLGPLFDQLIAKSNPQDKTTLTNLKNLASEMQGHHTGFMNQLEKADKAESFQSKAQLWSEAFGSSHFQALDKDLARYASLYTDMPNTLKTALGELAKQKVIQDLAGKEPHLFSAKDLTKFSTIGFAFESIKDAKQRETVLQLAVTIGSAGKNFGDTLVSPVQRGMRYGMLLGTVAKSASKAPNLKEVSETLSKLSTSVDDLHKTNDKIEGQYADLRKDAANGQTKPLQTIRPRMTSSEGTFLDLSNGIAASIAHSKLSKNDARPQIETALEQIVNAHKYGQATNAQLMTAFAQIKQLPQSKELLGGLFTGSTSFKEKMQSIEKAISAPVPKGGIATIVKELALGNSAGADITSFPALASTIGDMLNRLSQDPQRDNTAVQNLVRYATEGMKSGNLDPNTQQTMKNIANYAESMGLNNQAATIRQGL